MIVDYPSIGKNKTVEQNFEELKRWAYQLIDQLDYEFNRIVSERKKGENDGR